jgi:hypothetical protein
MKLCIFVFFVFINLFAFGQESKKNDDQSNSSHATERENKADKFNEEYLETQKISANSANIQKWTAIIQSFLSLVAGIFILLTLKETRKTAQASIKTANVAEKALSLSERAWIGLDLIELGNALSTGNISEIKFVIKNFGRAPAFNIKQVFGWHFVPISNLGPFELPETPMDSPSTVLFPNGSTNFSPFTNMQQVSQQQLDNIVNGISTIVILGRFEYLDGFSCIS